MSFDDFFDSPSPTITDFDVSRDIIADSWIQRVSEMNSALERKRLQIRQSREELEKLSRSTNADLDSTRNSQDHPSSYNHHQGQHQQQHHDQHQHQHQHYQHQQQQQPHDQHQHQHQHYQGQHQQCGGIGAGSGGDGSGGRGGGGGVPIRSEQSLYYQQQNHLQQQNSDFLELLEQKRLLDERMKLANERNEQLRASLRGGLARPTSGDMQLKIAKAEFAYSTSKIPTTQSRQNEQIQQLALLDQRLQHIRQRCNTARMLYGRDLQLQQLLSQKKRELMVAKQVELENEVRIQRGMKEIDLQEKLNYMEMVMDLAGKAWDVAPGCSSPPLLPQPAWGAEYDNGSTQEFHQWRSNAKLGKSMPNITSQEPSFDRTHGGSNLGPIQRSESGEDHSSFDDSVLDGLSSVHVADLRKGGSMNRKKPPLLEGLEAESAGSPSFVPQKGGTTAISASKASLSTFSTPATSSARRELDRQRMLLEQQRVSSSTSHLSPKYDDDSSTPNHRLSPGNSHVMESHERNRHLVRSQEFARAASSLDTREREHTHHRLSPSSRSPISSADARSARRAVEGRLPLGVEPSDNVKRTALEDAERQMQLLESQRLSFPSLSPKPPARTTPTTSSSPRHHHDDDDNDYYDDKDNNSEHVRPHAATTTAAATSDNNALRGKGDRPRTGGDRPSTASDRPRTGGDRSSTARDRPRTGGDRPSTASDRPRTGGDRPPRVPPSTTSRPSTAGGLGQVSGRATPTSAKIGSASGRDTGKSERHPSSAGRSSSTDKGTKSRPSSSRKSAEGRSTPSDVGQRTTSPTSSLHGRRLEEEREKAEESRKKFLDAEKRKSEEAAKQRKQEEQRRQEEQEKEKRREDKRRKDEEDARRREDKRRREEEERRREEEERRREEERKREEQEAEEEKKRLEEEKKASKSKTSKVSGLMRAKNLLRRGSTSKDPPSESTTKKNNNNNNNNNNSSSSNNNNNNTPTPTTTSKASEKKSEKNNKGKKGEGNDKGRKHKQSDDDDDDEPVTRSPVSNSGSSTVLGKKPTPSMKPAANSALANLKFSGRNFDWKKSFVEQMDTTDDDDDDNDSDSPPPRPLAFAASSSLTSLRRDAARAAPVTEGDEEFEELKF